MTRNPFLATCLLSLAAVPLLAVAAPSAEQILDKNAAARGGLAAWRAVQTLTTEGMMDAGGKPNRELPYVLRQKRPHKSRLEITFKDQTSVQVFDGSEGWKVRPFLNRTDAEPFTAAETEAAAATDELEGALIDYAAKGTRVAYVGEEPVDGHPAYKLKLTLKNGKERQVWIDAGTYLEVRMDGEPRRLDGRLHNVALYFRDYRPEHGLTVPHLQETVVEGTKQKFKLTVTKVAVNEPMADALFGKPAAAPAAKQP